MSKTYEPMRGYITVDLPEISEKTKGGIVKSQEMLDAERAKFSGACKIVHVCAEEKFLKPMDKVLLFGGATLTPVNVFGRELHQVASHHVMGRLTS